MHQYINNNKLQSFSHYQMGTLSIHGLHGSFKQEWTQIKHQAQTIIKNNYSEQQFKLISVPLTATTNLKPYFSREIFLLPKTPKVIVLEKQKDKIFILVEHPQISIVETLKIKNCYLTILLFLRDISNAVYALKKKYEPFLITQKMVKVCKNQNILVWFNEKYESNMVQLPLQNSLVNHEQIMIQSIINIFLRYSKSKAKILGLKFTKFVQFKQKIQSEINLQQECRQNLISQYSKKVVKKDLFSSQKQASNKINRISIDFIEGNRNSLGKNQRRTYLSNEKEGRRLIKLHSSKQLNKNHKFESLNKIKVNNMFSSEEESSKEESQRQNRRKNSQKKFKLNIKKINQKQEKIVKFTKKSYSPSKSEIKVNNPTNTNAKLHTHTRANNSKANTYSNIDYKSHTLTNIETLQLNQHRFSSQSNTEKQQSTQVHIFKGNSYAFKKKGTSNSIQYQTSQSNQFLKLSKGSKTSEFTSVGSFSRKNHSLKSTSGTVRRTKQFQQQIKFTYIQQEQIIKQQSDQTHKNSMSLSQDLDKLFPMSGKGSIQMDQQSQQRQHQFQKLLFD